MQIDLDALERAAWNQSMLHVDDCMALIAKVRELQADRDCWAEQASQRVKDWDDMRQRAEAAEQRVRELEQENALLREVVAEYNDCIRYMDAGGDFHEFQRITIDAARGGQHG